MGKYNVQTDLEAALSVETVLRLYDNGNGSVDTAALEAENNRAEAEVDSYLPSNYRMPLEVPTDRLVKHAALQFWICFSFERHPEYVRTFGEDPRAARLYERATALMQRIGSAIQRLPDNPKPPGNVGGVITQGGSRFMIDGPDGTNNSGDF